MCPTQWTVLRSSWLRQLESTSIYMTLLYTYKGSQMAKNSWIEITQMLCMEESFCQEVSLSICDRLVDKWWMLGKVEALVGNKTCAVMYCSEMGFPEALH